MFKKSFISITLTATLTLGTFSSFLTPTNSATASTQSNVTNATKLTNNQNSPTYKTASTKTFKLVRTNKSAKIYTKATTKSRVMDTIKNDQGLVVLKKYTNGWSKVSLQFDYGYIQSKYLVNASPNLKTRYAMNTQKIYSYYSPENKGSEFNNYYKAAFKTNYPSVKWSTRLQKDFIVDIKTLESQLLQLSIQ